MSTRTCAARASWNERVTESRRPSPFGENARDEDRRFENVRSTMTDTAALTVFVPFDAVRTIVYLPSVTLSAAKENVCFPDARRALKIVASCRPSTSRSVAVTVAAVVSVYVTVARSSTPSPFGEIVPGFALEPLSASAAGAAPRKPVAGRTSSPAAIVHAYRPGAEEVASQVQSTAVPLPDPVATVIPSESVTETVQGRSSVSVALNSTGPPSRPRTDGA